MIGLVIGVIIGVVVCKYGHRIKDVFFQKSIVKIGDKYALQKSIFGVKTYKELKGYLWLGRGSASFLRCLGTQEDVEKVSQTYGEPEFVSKVK